MASMKRKSDESEVRQGSFQENSLPSDTFPLGEDVFISCKIFNERMMVHIRRYKKFGAKFYPSTEGITLTPYQFIYLVSCPCLKEKSTNKTKNSPLYEFFIDLPPLIDPVIVHSKTSVSIRDEYKWHDCVDISFEETIRLEKKFTSRSGKVFTSSIVLDDVQWGSIFSFRERLFENLCEMKYSCVNFKGLFETILENSAPTTAPEEDVTILRTLNYLLQLEIYQQLANYEDLVNPFDANQEELLKNSQEKFYEAAIMLKPFDIVNNFYSTVKNNTQHPRTQESLLNFVTVPFLNSINLVEIFQTAKDHFCPQ